MLQDLKDKGLYDAATIIITTDHGDKKEGEYAMFLLKRAGAKGQYTTSSAPVSHFDLPVYLSSLVGRKLENDYGKSYDEVGEDEERERHMFYNTSGNSKLRINEYATEGAAGDFDGWKVINKYEDSVIEKYTLGTTLSFATEATGNQYTVEGFGNNTGFQTKMFGPVSTLRIPFKDLPKSGELKVTMTFQSTFQHQYVISANDIQVFNSATDLPEPAKEIVFTAPVDSVSDDHVLTLEIRFPEIEESEMEKKVKKRTHTGGLVTLLIQGE